MTTAEHARLKDHVASMTGGLEAKVYEGGKELPLPPTPPPPQGKCKIAMLTHHPGFNLSQGQKQMVSLARALLTQTNILVLDEATVSIFCPSDDAHERSHRRHIRSSRGRV